MAALSRQYHCQIKPVSRSAGRSVVAAAAYRAGVALTDQRTGIVHDYTRKRGVVLAEVLTPPGCDWARDRGALWDAVESRSRANSRLATECELAIPHELTPAQAAALVRGFSAEIVAEHHVAADLAIHRPHRRQGGGDPRNAHAHVLFSHLPVEPDGLGKRASKAFSGAAAVEHVRVRWAEHVNAAYRAAGLDVRQDHRSYAAQALDLVPGQHLGPAATTLERAGTPTAPGDRNRAARAANQERHRARRAEQHSQAVALLPAIRLPEWAPGDPRSPRHVERPPRERSGAQSRETRDYVARLAYGQPLPPAVIDQFDRLWTFREPADALKLRLADGSGRLLDRGDQIAYQPARGHRADTASAVAAALDLAEAKGWRSIVLSGPASFQCEAARQAVARGLEVEDPSPEIAALIADERARLSVEQEPTHRALIDRINAHAETATPAALRDDLTASALPAPGPTVAAIGAQVERQGTPPVRAAWTDATRRRAVARAY
ncbi:MobA/MobL family protein, partial [Azospirillum doebereinerae]|nr:MobA/MobL family protein [Azospirillum doebereinerae]